MLLCYHPVSQSFLLLTYPVTRCAKFIMRCVLLLRSQMTPSHVRLGCPMLPNETIQYLIVWPFGSQTLHKTAREHGHSTCHSKAWNRFGLAWGTVSMFLMIGELCMSWGKSQCRRSPAKKLERHCWAPKLGGKIATDCNWQLGSWLRKSRGFEDLHNTSRSFHNPNRLRTNEKYVISRIMAIISIIISMIRYWINLQRIAVHVLRKTRWRLVSGASEIAHTCHV